MSAPAHSSAEAAPSSSAGGSALGAAKPTRVAPAVGSDDGSLPVAGACWRGKYEIASQIDDGSGTPTWRGRAVDGGHEVVLRAIRPTDPEARTQAWSKLGGIDSPHLQHARDAQRAGEWRIEIADVVPGVPLHEWRAGRQSIDAPTIKAIVSQLAECLGALHAFALVHLNLRPEVVFVEQTGTEIFCRVGGLDAVTTFDRSEPVPAAVDPFYAPPEALGLNLHVPGAGLCAWDWWALGRVVQEAILGQHIAGQLAKAATHPPTPEARARAESLLMEADAKGPRAGAVESMSGLDASTTLMLRGLLTSAKDARWTGDNVDRWLRGLPVKEHYSTPRAETHFRWRGRPCTVQEIATILQSAEHWAENSVQLFESTTPGTMAHFLRWSISQATAHEQLTAALELAEMLPLKLSSPAAQREAVTAVGLMSLSGSKLVWRGRAFEASTVGAMLDELGETDGLMVLRALSTRSTALQVERVDAAAGRLLTELGRVTGDVESILRRYGWLPANDIAGAARVFRLALEPIATLRSNRDTLAQSFAGSDHAAIEKMFKAQGAGRTELVVLAWAAPTPERFKFFTHAEAARRRADALRTRGVELINALAWAQLERAMAVGPIVFGGWGWFILTWFFVGLAAIVLWPGLIGVGAAFVPAIVALLLRILFGSRPQRSLRDYVPEAKWTWRDGPARCQRELRVAGRGIGRAALETELGNVGKELAELKNVQPTPAPLPDLPQFGVLRFAGVVSWVVLAAFVGVGAWRVYAHPPSAKEWKAAWAPPVDQKPGASTAHAVKAADEKPAEVKVSWPYRPSDTAEKASLRSTQAATPEQVEYAKKHGRDLVAPYRPETIDTPIILPVPSGEAVGVMIFDGKRGELYNEQVYFLGFEPIPRTWVEVAGRKGIYLDR